MYSFPIQFSLMPEGMKVIVIDYLMPVGVLISLARISSTTLSLAFFDVSSSPY